ncbi:MAG: hypothetical protein PHC90_13560 [Syntrophorhabdaceae bacterium]|nr:hypothetical protein [Syntrophorhabdaceae bacterium]
MSAWPMSAHFVEHGVSVPSCNIGVGFCIEQSVHGIYAIGTRGL